MPRKNFYVRAADLPLFERAEQLGEDSLSAVIAEAVRRYVEVKEAEAQGMQEYTLEVGVWRAQGADDTRKIRFVGRLLAEAEVLTGQTSSRDDRGTDYKIYQTKAGKILVWWKKWTRWERENDTADYAVLDQLPGYDDEVCGTVRGARLHHLPGDVLRQAAEALGQEVEYIE